MFFRWFSKRSFENHRIIVLDLSNLIFTRFQSHTVKNNFYKV